MNPLIKEHCYSFSGQICPNRSYGLSHVFRLLILPGDNSCESVLLDILVMHKASFLD